MWVYTKRGFFSIVQDKEDNNYLIVRARVKGDIEHYFPKKHVQEDEGTDYRFRILLHREIVTSWMFEVVADIDYTNFKAAVGAEDKRRSEYYGMVWAIMCDMQDHFLDESRKEEE